MKDLEKDYGVDLKAQGISLDGLQKVINNYKTVSKIFENRLDSINRT